MAKILVVEDMDSVVDLLRSLLHREGFEVAVAQDGPEALEAVRREKPDLILLDLILPGPRRVGGTSPHPPGPHHRSSAGDRPERKG